MSAQSDALDKLLSTTPELQTAPGVALPVSQIPGDPQQYGQALAQVQRSDTFNQSVQEHTAKVGGHSAFAKTLGFFGHVVSDATAPLGDVLGAGLHYAGAPLREVQHQYRYIHDVWDRHGPIEAMLELLPAAGIMTLAAATDIFTAGLATPVTTLAAEGATGLMARGTDKLLHQDSWGRTEHGEAYLDKSGAHVSFGRDVGKALGHIPGINTQVGKHGEGWVSGALDAIADLGADPLAQLGHLRGEALSAEGAGKGAGVLNKIWGGMSVSNVENAWNEGKAGVAGYRRFHQAVTDLSQISNEGQIVRKYGQNLAPIAGRLAKASTPEEVVDVFRGVANTGEMVSGRLPTKSFTRVPFSKLYEAMADPTGNAVQKVVAKSVRMQNVFDPDTLSFSTKSFTVDDKGMAKASEGVYRALLPGMKPADAADVVTQLYRSGSQVERDEILNAAWMKMFDGFGIQTIEVKNADGVLERIPLQKATDEQIRRKLFSKIEDTTGNRGGGPPLARGADGRNLSGFPNPDGSIENVPVHVGDIDPATGEIVQHQDVARRAFPDYQAMRKELAGVQRMKVFNGGLGDWWYEHYTAGVFKPLALNTFGFAFRVASGEIIPQMFRGETLNLLKSRVALSLANDGRALAEDEAPHFYAAWTKAAREHILEWASNSTEDAAKKAELIGHMVHDSGGATMNPQLAAGHDVSSVDGDGIRFDNAITQLQRAEPPSQMAGRPLGDFEGRDINEIYQWQHDIERHAQDGPTRVAAQALLKGLTPKVPEVTSVPQIAGEAPTIPATATPEGALPEAWKPAPTAAAPVGVPKGPAPEVAPEAQRMAELLQSRGVPWKAANKYSDDEWTALAQEAGLTETPPPTMRRDTRLWKQYTESADAPTAAAPAGPEAVRIKSGHYEVDTPEGKVVIKRVRPRGEASEWHVERPGIAAPAVEATAAGGTPEDVLAERVKIRGLNLAGKIDDAEADRRLAALGGEAPSAKPAAPAEAPGPPTHLAHAEEPPEVLNMRVGGENIRGIIGDQAEFGGQTRIAYKNGKFIVSWRKDAEASWRSASGELRDAALKDAAKRSNNDAYLSALSPEGRGWKVKEVEGKGWLVSGPDRPQAYGPGGKLGGYHATEDEALATMKAEAAKASHPFAQVPDEVPLDKGEMPHREGHTGDRYRVVKIDDKLEVQYKAGDDGTWVAVEDKAEAAQALTAAAAKTKNPIYAKYADDLEAGRVKTRDEEAGEFLASTKPKAAAPSGPKEVYASLDEAKAAVLGQPAAVEPGPTTAPTAAAPSPAEQGARPEGPKKVQFGRAKSGEYGFEAYPKEGGVVSQGKIIKTDAGWTVQYPGETEVGSVHKTLREAQAEVQSFATKSQAAENARRIHNIARDIDPRKAIELAEQRVHAWLNNAPDELLEHNPRHWSSNVPGASPHQAWSKVLVKNLLGSVTKPGMAEEAVQDALHMDVLEDIANGRTTDLDTLAAKPAEHRPDSLVGPAHTMPGLPGGESLVRKIANFGHQKIFSPMINYMSREPMYANLFVKEYEGGLEAAVHEGLLQPHEARMIAQQRASYNMSKLVHNLSERTYMSEGLRNWAPFLFAEQQSWRRMGQLLVDDPGAFRKFQLASSILSDIGNPTKGEDGSSQILFPGEGWLAGGTAKILNKLHVPIAGAVPVMFTGTVQSLGPVFPLADVQMPSGPMVSLGVKTMATMFPELTPAAEHIVGSAGMQQSFMDMIIPNSTLRGLYHTFTGDHNRAFMNAQLYVIQDLARQQQAEDLKAAKEGREAKEIVPSDNASAITKQDFLNRVKNQTRIIMGIRAIAATFNPTATNAEIGNSQLRDEVRADIKAKGMSQGIQDFLVKHPDASPYTVFTSEANSQAPLSASSEVGSWLEQNLNTLKGYAYGGAWLIPQAKNNFDQGVYNEQLAMNLRQRKAPDQFFKDIQIASSNNQYYAMKDQYDAAVKEAGTDKAKVASLGRKWSALKAAFGAQNPIWYEDYQSPDRRIMRDNTLVDFRRMFNDPSIAQSPELENIKDLVGNYDKFVAASMPGRTDAVASAARKSAERRWDSYLDQLRTEKPELEPLILKVFKGATVQAAMQAQQAALATPELNQMIAGLTPDQLAGISGGTG